MNRKDRVALNNFAQRCFRNVADEDYIAARACFRTGVMLQFAWMSQQAIEKYLKSILLFNQVSSKGIGHDLRKALRRVKRIERIRFSISDSAMEFIDFADRHGVNRYLERAHCTRGFELPQLDKCIWELRLFCQPLDYEHRQLGSMLERNLQTIDHWRESPRPFDFAIQGGRIESILKSRDDPRRKELIWQNAFFANRDRKHIKIPSHANSINPPHLLYPDRFDLFKEYVQFPRSLIEELERQRPVAE